ncbi:MAG: hypothetical protein JNK85_25795 [Verrucomicrobiales bacterium]|nr:hypothetical protein [Verrucomicrobiales bacterium]
MRRLASWPVTHFLIGALIILIDLETGTFLQFPILFVVPVGLCAWFANPPGAYVLSVALPLARVGVVVFVEHPHPVPYALANAAIRMTVLLGLSILIARLARREREIRERLETLVRVCAWSRTVEFEGEWLSFEQYLSRRFGIKTTHGISPAEFEKMMGNSVTSEDST